MPLNGAERELSTNSRRFKINLFALFTAFFARLVIREIRFDTLLWFQTSSWPLKGHMFPISETWCGLYDAAMMRQTAAMMRQTADAVITTTKDKINSQS